MLFGTVVLVCSVSICVDTSTKENFVKSAFCFRETLLFTLHISLFIDNILETETILIKKVLFFIQVSVQLSFLYQQ